MPGVAGVPGVTPGVGVVPGVVPGVGVPGVVPGAGMCFVTPYWGPVWGQQWLEMLKAIEPRGGVAEGDAGRMGDGGTWEGCRGDSPDRGVLICFAGIPQVGVQPGAKPPKFGTYLSHPVPSPPWTITWHPPCVAIGVLALLRVPCVAPSASAEGGPGMGGGGSVTHGCKVPLVPPPLDLLGTFFSCSALPAAMCHAGDEPPPGLLALGAVRWVLGTPSMGVRATPAGRAPAGGALSCGCWAVGGQGLMVSLWQAFPGLESQGSASSQVGAGRS